MSRSNFFFLFFFFFFSPTKIYISSTRVFLRSKKYTTNTNVIELGRRERERERKVERSPLSIIFFHQLILNGTRSISSATVAIPGIELAPRRALVTSRPTLQSARNSFFPFFFFISRGFFAFRLVSPRTAMAVHRRCSRVYSSVARTFYRFYPRPTSDFDDGKSIFRDENHPATQLRHSD